MREARIEIPKVELLEELGRGGYGVVYRARREGRHYAVKLPAGDGAPSPVVGERFLREAVSLARVRHAALPRVMEVGRVGDVPYIIMELVAGETLAERLKQGPLSIRQAIELGRQLADALAAVHGAGLVHRDVKPRNVVFDSQTTAVRLVDFGFAVAAVPSGTLGDTAGTPGYMAPEQSRALLERVDGRADLYSLGCVLFRSIVGELPATAVDARAAIWRAAADASEDAGPRRVVTSLADIVARLLAARPDDRFPSAHALIAALDALEEGEAARPTRRASPAPPFDEVAPAHVPFIGRKTERDALRRAWSDVRAGRAAVTGVLGAAGSGKTRLMRNLADEVATAGYVVMAAASRSSDLRSFAIIRRLLDAYVRSCNALPGADRLRAVSRLRELAGDIAPLLKVLSPTLAEIFEDAASLPRFEDAEHVFAAGLSEYLIKLLAEQAPCLVLIDDVQWIDRGSRRVLQQVVNRFDETGSALVLGCRVGEEARAAFDSVLAMTPPERVQGIEVGPLTQDEVARLMAAYLGHSSIDRELQRYAFGLSDGSPLGALEVVRAMLDSGALVPFWGEWKLDQEAAAAMQLPAATVGIVASRVAALDETTRATLQVAAVIGSAFYDELLPAATELDVGQVYAALSDARRAVLIEPAPNGRHRFVHDAVREALLESLDAEQERRAHLRIAHAMDGFDPSPPSPEAAPEEESLLGTALALRTSSTGIEQEIGLDERGPMTVAEGDLRFDLATHYALGQSDDSAGRVFETSIEAGRLAVRAFDNERALTFFRNAERAAEQLSRRIEPEIQFLMAESLLRTGDLVLSLERFERVTASRVEPLLRSLALSRVAWIQMQLDVDAAWQAIGSAFRVLGVRPPSPTAGGVLRAIASWVWGRLRPRRRVGSPSERRQLEVLSALYYQTGRLAFQSSRPIYLIQAALRSLEPAERLGPSASLANSHLMYSFVLTALGWRRAGRRYLDQAREVAAATRDPIVGAHTLQVESAIAAWAGDIDRSLAASRRTLEDYGHWRELGEYCLTVYNHQQIEGIRGRNLEAWRWLEAAMRRIAHYEGTPLAVDYIDVAARGALCSLGREGEADQLLSRVRTHADDLCKGVFVVSTWGARVRVFTERGDIGPEFEALVQEFESHGFNPRRVHLEVTEYYVHVAHAFVYAALRANENDRPRYLERLDKALSDLRGAARIPLLDAHRLAVEAYHCWFSGRRNKAEHLFAKAEALAEEQNAPWVLYAVHRGRAHMLLSRGRDSAARDQAKLAEALVMEHGAAHRLDWIREEFGLRGTRRHLLGTGSSSSRRPSSHRIQTSSSSHSVGSPARAYAYLRALLRITQAQSAELEPQNQAKLVLDELVHALGARRGLLFLSQEVSAPPSESSHELALVAARLRDGKDAPDPEDYDRDLVENVYRLGGTEIGEVGVPSSSMRTSDATAGTRWSLAAPLLLRGIPVGVVCLDKSDDSGTFTENDGEILYALASQVPVVLELARSLYERERAAENQHKSDRLEAVSRMAGGVAHDFNNMLAVIDTAAHNLDRTPAAAAVSEDTEAILSAASRARELTKQLMAFARGQFLRPVALQLNDSIEQLLPTFRRVLGPSVKIAVDCTPGLEVVRADPAQVDQVLTNLVMNAGDAMPGGGRLVIETRNVTVDREQVRLHPRLKEGRFVQITVTDSGEGMSEETQAKLFEPFFTTKEKKGTGLGLATVYGIVTQSGGCIDVRSELGVGTAFRLYFPVSAETRPPRSTKQRGVLPRGSETILVVDDEPLVRDAIARQLRRLGYSVMVADGADAALRVANDLGSDLDLVISDVLMPDTNGLDLARELAKSRPELKVLYMSGYTDGVLAERGILRNQVEFLQKPIDYQKLAQKIREVLEPAPEPTW